MTGALNRWTICCAERGHQVVSIGKLHFRQQDDDNGFSDEQTGCTYRREAIC